MVDVAVGETDEPNRRRRNVELIELLLQPLGDDPVRSAPITGDAARYLKKFVGNARTLQKIAARMMDEIAIVRQLKRLIVVIPGRKTTLVRRRAMTAVKHVQPINT
jgi:hypothetical protein